MGVFVLTAVSPSVGDRPALPLLKQQFSISELIACRGDSQNHLVGSEETGLQDHSDENCLYCVGAIVLGYPTQPQINSTHPRTGEQSRTHSVIHTLNSAQKIFKKLSLFCQTMSTSHHGEGRAAIAWR